VQSRAGRSPEPKEETLEGSHSEYYGTSNLEERDVKIHHHGQQDEGQQDKVEEAVRIAWNPLSKKPIGFHKKMFKSNNEGPKNL